MVFKKANFLKNIQIFSKNNYKNKWTKKFWMFVSNIRNKINKENLFNLRFPIGYIKNGVQKKVHLFENFLPSFFQFLLLTHNIDSETLRMGYLVESEFRKKPVFQVDFQNYEKKSQKSTFFEKFSDWDELFSAWYYLNEL